MHHAHYEARWWLYHAVQFFIIYYITVWENWEMAPPAALGKLLLS